MATNTKKVKITIPNESVLRLVKSTPTLNRLSRTNLVVGDNTESVNHFQYSEMKRLFTVVGIDIIEL